jgi:hypothetical protein
MYEKPASQPMVMNESGGSLPTHGGSDYAAVDDGLAMTPWERILANDDMINFGEMLRTAMEKRNAKSR